jgi:hypothetical protein
VPFNILHLLFFFARIYCIYLILNLVLWSPLIEVTVNQLMNRMVYNFDFYYFTMQHAICSQFVFKCDQINPCVPNDGIGWRVLWCESIGWEKGNWVTEVYSPKTRCIIHSKTLESTVAKRGLNVQQPGIFRRLLQRRPNVSPHSRHQSYH